jgi:hypothetical protein
MFTAAWVEGNGEQARACAPVSCRYGLSWRTNLDSFQRPPGGDAAGARYRAGRRPMGYYRIATKTPPKHCFSS